MGTWFLKGQKPDAMPVVYATKGEEARRGRGEDRIAVFRLPDRTVFVVADGAGGVPGGVAAAETVCGAVAEACHHGKPGNWSEWLALLDHEMVHSKASGLAAAVVLEIGDDGLIVGASVGDCGAWVFGDGIAPRDLTSGQIRKPLLGEGSASPVGFEGRIGDGTLLMATDGLWKYTDHARIARAVSIRPLEAAAAALVDGVRLRSGALQDDVAVAICQVTRRREQGSGR